LHENLVTVICTHLFATLEVGFASFLFLLQATLAKEKESESAGVRFYNFKALFIKRHHQNH